MSVESRNDTPLALEQWGRRRNAALPIFRTKSRGGLRPLLRAQPDIPHEPATPAPLDESTGLAEECAALRVALDLARSERDKAMAALADDLAATLVTRLDESLALMRQQVGEELSSALESLIPDAARRQAVDAFHALLDSLMGDETTPALHMEGPADLMDRIAALAGEKGWRLALHPTEATEISLHLGRTRIVSAIGEWSALITKDEAR